MRLSPRRYAFLETLFRMARACGGPVHYADLAREMGVSRWTAYDMMRELAKDGLVAAVYARSDPGYPGRSQVLFLTTEKGARLIESRAEISSTTEEWSKLKQRMLSKFGVALEQKKGFEFFRKELASNSSALFCAAVVAALIVEARRVGLDLVLAGRVLSLADLEAGPLLLVGFVAGSLLVSGLTRKLPAIGSLLERFARELRSFGGEERQALAGFAREVLGKATSA